MVNEKEKVVVSACLFGTRCRWHGKVCNSKAARRIIADMGDVETIQVCPEMLGGLPCPRPPVKRRHGRVYQTCEDKALRKDVTGKDVTAEFRKGAEAVLELCRRERVRRTVLCVFSPSCDKNGVCGRLLRENGIEVINSF